MTPSHQKFRVLFSHPTGNANARAALAGLQAAGLLQEFHTSVAAFSGSVWGAVAKSSWGREFQRRSFADSLQPLTVQHPWRELGRMVASRLNLSRLTRHETGLCCIDIIYQAQDRQVAQRLRRAPKSFTGVYAYEDGALASLTAARELGLAGHYDLPIGYWRTARRLLESEFQRHPEFAATLTGFKDSTAKLARKDAELAQASQIFVASSFTAQTLRDYPGRLPAPVVIPYGFPPARPEVARAVRGPVTSSHPLRLLFVGGLSQRKGIADLFAAAKTIGGAVSLTVIGSKVGVACPALDRELALHRWIPSLPHDQILAEMHAHDVLVFPSLFEGFGLVITEAMSQGTPVITTDRTAGPDLITHGRNGWLIPAGNTEALVRQIEELVRHPELIRSAGENARATAAARPWSVYGRELAAAVRSP